MLACGWPHTSNAVAAYRGQQRAVGGVPSHRVQHRVHLYSPRTVKTRKISQSIYMHFKYKCNTTMGAKRAHREPHLFARQPDQVGGRSTGRGVVGGLKPVVAQTTE